MSDLPSAAVPGSEGWGQQPLHVAVRFGFASWKAMDRAEVRAPPNWLSKATLSACKTLKRRQPDVRVKVCVCLAESIVVTRAHAATSGKWPSKPAKAPETKWRRRCLAPSEYGLSEFGTSVFPVLAIIKRLDRMHIPVLQAINPDASLVICLASNCDHSQPFNMLGRFEVFALGICAVRSCYNDHRWTAT